LSDKRDFSWQMEILTRFTIHKSYFMNEVYHKKC
jgi:hypothetical protein